MSFKDGCQAFLISGIENKDPITGIKQIHLDCNYYHTVEALCLMIFITLFIQ